jgi:curved DNA-binding protein CbpA
MLECRNCGAGAPVDEHFCPQCSRILALGRHGDYFTFLGLPRKLLIDPQDLERRFRDLSRKFHPDYFYNATSAERLASLERSSYLNDAYRALKNPVSRIEHLLAIEGLPSARSEDPRQARATAAKFRRRCSRKCSPSTKNSTRYVSCANRARIRKAVWPVSRCPEAD